MCRRVQNDNQAFLHIQQFLHFSLKICSVEVSFFVKELESVQLSANISGNGSVWTPVPVGQQNLVTCLRVVGNGAVNRTGTAGSRHNLNETFWAETAKGIFLYGFLICRKTGNWCVFREICSGQRLEHFIYRRNYRQVTFFIQQNAQG